MTSFGTIGKSCFQNEYTLLNFEFYGDANDKIWRQI